MHTALDELVANTGVVLPLTASIIKLILESGASQIEVAATLQMVKELVNLLPMELIAPAVSASRPRS